MASENPPTDPMKTAHVLFMDIVGYSKLSIDEQVSAIHTLQEIVHGTPQVTRAQAADQLTSIPTGDGMALVFFSEPTAPVECALEVGKALKNHPELELRMGVHSGPVNEIIDVNGRINVAGSGINMAQRVMDSGDAGHILLSKRVAEDLSHYSRWKPLLHDLSEIEVKHSVRVHLFNLYTDEVGNPVLPQKVRNRKTRTVTPWFIMGALALILVGVGIALALRQRGTSAPRPAKPESHYRALLEQKVPKWVEAIFTAQAGNGGIKMSLSSDDATTQVWQTAQCLTAVLSAQTNLESHVPKIRSAFEYMEGLHRSTPSEGWNLYGNGNIYTLTDIGSWVAIANVRSLDSKTQIWSAEEKENVIQRLVRDIDEINRRQDSSGGWRPIRDDNPDFIRTYPTVMAMWLLVEAKKSPALSEQIGSKYDENIRRGIQWLLRSYKEGQGLVPNPNRLGQKEGYAGLTAHALFVLSHAETLPAFGYIRNDNTYRAAKQDFIRNGQFATWRADANNSHIPDADVRFINTEHQAEGSTFLWFPWTLVELSRLSADTSLSEDERKAAAQLRADIFHANSESLGNFVEAANLIYVMAENLFCVATYLDAASAASR